MTTSEKLANGQLFLDYVAVNEAKLKKNLKKNITFDDELFDDVFHDTIIRCYDAIVNKGVEIDDYEKYFFIASKYQFINTQNKKRKEQSMKVDSDEWFRKNDMEDIPYNEDELTAEEELNNLKNKIINQFGEYEADIFFDYYTKKSKSRISYKTYSQDNNISSKKLGEIIKKIKRYIKEEI